MALTLNIIERELALVGEVARRSLRENPQFEGVRFHMEGQRVDRSLLYVCATPEAAEAVAADGCHAVCARPSAEGPCPQAMLTVLGDLSPLAVLDVLLDAFARYDRWERAMDATFNGCGTLQDLFDLSEPFLRNNVVVLDAALKLLAYTKGVPCDDPITMELIEHGYHTEDNIRKFKLHRRFKPWAESSGFVVNDTRAICKYVTIVKSFKARASFALICVMMCNVADPEPYLFDVFKMFVERVERFAERDYPDDKPSGNVVDTFLKDLIGGGIPDEGDVIERSRFAGIPHAGRFCLFYLKAERDSVPGSRLLADVSLAVAPAKTVLIDDAVVVLCFNCTSDSCSLACIAHECPHGKQTVSQRLEAMLGRYDLTCGRSSLFSSLSDAPVAFAQARRALTLHHAKGTRRAGGAASGAWERIFAFDMQGADLVAGELSDETVALLAKSRVGTLLDALARQDGESKTNNYEFLRSYLIHERRVSVVAEHLHMHRNNVSYRINRIQEQFGIDTEDESLRQDLLLAFRLRDALL